MSWLGNCTLKIPLLLLPLMIYVTCKYITFDMGIHKTNKARLIRKTNKSPLFAIILNAESCLPKHLRNTAIFFIDDVTLSFNQDAPVWMKMKNNPFNVFTDFLLEYQPAGAVVEHGGNMENIKKCWGTKCKGIPRPELTVVIGFDALFDAYHRDTIDLLLPFNNLDYKSIWLSQRQVNFQVHVAYYGQFVLFPYVTVGNLVHRKYKRGDFLDDKPIINTMIEDVRARAPASMRNHSMFEYLKGYKDLRDYLCKHPPKPKSKIVACQMMYNDIRGKGQS